MKKVVSSIAAAAVLLAVNLSWAENPGIPCDKEAVAALTKLLPVYVNQESGDVIEHREYCFPGKREKKLAVSQSVWVGLVVILILILAAGLVIWFKRKSGGLPSTV
ncbi:MAG: hypothetical protein WAP51_04495 [Candidatus Sungiibacteriota bacterium]